MQWVKSLLHIKKKNVKGLTILIQNMIQISARNFYTSTLGYLKYTLNTFPNITCTQSFQNILTNQNTARTHIYQSPQGFESCWITCLLHFKYCEVQITLKIWNTSSPQQLLVTLCQYALSEMIFIAKRPLILTEYSRILFFWNRCDSAIVGIIYRFPCNSAWEQARGKKVGFSPSTLKSQENPRTGNLWGNGEINAATHSWSELGKALLDHLKIKKHQPKEK